TLSAVGESREPAAEGFDYAGAATLAAGVLALVLGAGDLGNSSATDPAGIALVTASGGLFVVFWAIEARRRDPIFDLGLFRARPFLAGFVAAIVLDSSYWIIFLYFPIYFEAVNGYSALVTGLILLPLAASFFVTEIVGGRLATRVTSRTLFASAMVVVALGGVWLLFVGSGDPWTAFLGAFVLIGGGTGLYQAESTRISAGAAKPGHEGSAAGMNFTLRGLSFSVFFALFEVLFSQTVTTGFLGRVSGTPLAAYGPTLAPYVTTGSFSYAASLLPSDVLRAAFYPIANASLFQGIQLIVVFAIVGSLVGAALCAWLLGRVPTVPR
ncbi:MAG: MFS transporter, partial [Thermoplasmata archaeon]|nr:MFS transporter [Thermoplasmata archaeon]